MKIFDIYNVLDEIAPFKLQESWDNSGLIIGSMDDNFEDIYLSLDLDTNLIKNANNNSLFITHHPLIFKGLKSINVNIYPSNIISLMLKKDIKLISMHTNYDISILNRFVLEEVLGYKVEQENGYVLNFVVNKKFDTFLMEIKSKFGMQNLKYTKSKDFIKTASLCTGSGSDLLDFSNCGDCFLSGDFKYHTALQCYENGVSLVDIEHFHSEKFFALSLAKILQKYKISAIIRDSVNPFKYF